MHTNLGRAPFGVDVDAHYTNLEFDLETGQRGSRQTHAGVELARACGAEAAIVVNNGAAAILLVLAALAQGRGVAISRGELIEVGGGFRIPDVLDRSGARLVEVGTTNRTRRADYEAVLADIDLILKVHPSNYRIDGFTASVDVSELAGLGPPVVADLGSGLLDAACPWLSDGPPPWIAHEPAARQTLTKGAALVTFSGDKLLGGPQAGIIAGRRDLVERCASHPLYRPLRPGGLVLRLVASVASAYLDRTAGELPFWRMATTSVDTLRARAEALAREAAVAGIATAVARPCTAVTGGGTLPGVEIPSWCVELPGDHTAALRRLRPIPVIAAVADDITRLNVRTVATDEDAYLAAAFPRVSG